MATRVALIQGHPDRGERHLLRALANVYAEGAHALKGLERNILGFAGIGPIKETLYGLVEARSDVTRGHWLKAMRELGREGK